jgi:hypothetical protein
MESRFVAATNEEFFNKIGEFLPDCRKVTNGRNAL